IATINPFNTEYSFELFDGASNKHLPAFLLRDKSFKDVHTHREFNASHLYKELSKLGVHYIRANNSEAMLHDFLRMLSLSLPQSRNALITPSLGVHA
ncbi:MAG: DUF58 domain-containing protein, partial [Bifidobacteriaceae bacterium]|nr:DUF58 domain-containing protein [Bifidobacteriaceae bacterium]